MSTIIPTSRFTANASSTATDSSTATSTLPTQSLSEQDFLTLLVKQMTTQDPTNPQSDTNFIAQMAQFSSLEQAKTMEGDLSQLSSAQQATQANSLLGQTVVVQVDKTTTAQGVVSAVDLSAGTPQLVVNGQNYNLSQVITVTPTTTQ